MNVRIRDADVPSADDGPNRRQLWFLAELAIGRNVKAADLALQWNVTDKTARRDIRALKARGRIVFIGPRKTGRYRLNET